MLALSCFLCAAALVFLGVLLLLSPGRLRPIVDENGKRIPNSINEKIHVGINGIQQGMIIRSADPSNPVLLFVHGGPGMPAYLLERDYPTGLEKDFTVVWWDQRGAGLSYHPGIPPQTMTADQYVDDTIAVTNYLRKRFGQDKIYLLGLSWGSYIGIQAAAKAPELYHAYIGMSQISYQLKSENDTYAYMLEEYAKRGDTGMVRKLEAAPVTMQLPMSREYLALRDPAMHGLGVGTTHAMKGVITGIFIPSWLDTEYTIGEKMNIWRGRAFSRSFGLWDEMQGTDLTTQVTELRIPTYFVSGVYDYTVSRSMAKSYLETLKAPVKGFYTFQHSAHGPAYEEPERMRQILRQDVLAAQTTLADGD
jgi:pimeloyl-ACP methyl ester carboxylesterase